ncbi:MAG TPA: pectin acetylesterase-family hydrolase [Longimicrobiales bacterium]|nr:pectin acetylesterase-family hydrolase [Longimicrobiales bacterium]
MVPSTHFIRSVALAVLACAAAVPGVAGAQELPTFADLAEGWNVMKPGGETICAHGTEYVFHVRPGTPERALIYLYGGGACWDAEGCEAGSDLYTDSIRPDRHDPRRLHGVLALDRADNPFRDYTLVAIPVCTGDVHLGARDTGYRLEAEDGSVTEFTIRHRGQVNVMSAVAWLQRNLRGPSEIFVAGSSAGSLAVPFYSDLLARAYPATRVTGLGDDAGSYSVAGFDAAVWGLPDALRRHAGWEDFPAQPAVTDLFITAGTGPSNLRLYQFDHAYDDVQRSFLERADVAAPDVAGLIAANRAAIRHAVPSFRGYTSGGFRHVVLVAPTFYQYATGGVRLVDWVADLAAGEDVGDVECGACERPEVRYEPEDLRIAERALELAGRPGAWDPRDVGGACRPGGERFTLRCLMSQASRDVMGPRPFTSPVGWDVIYSASARLGHMRNARAILEFNNRPGTTVEDVIALLEEVRDRIRAAQ